jgi:surface carbohydrate biosynthesis protein
MIKKMTFLNKPALLMPVENQVRELDAKLLLACIAAKRGLHSIIGFKRDVEFRIASLPRSVFLSKSLRIGNRKIFRLIRELGHEIVAWDEESLVHLPPDMYYSRRLSSIGMVRVSHLFAWGEDNAELWRKYPHLPPGIPIHVTGNPRGDLLRPEISAYYSKEADEIRKAYGRFLLVNTNFNHINAFYPAQNLFQPVARPGDPPELGQAARGMRRDYAEGLRDHKQAVLDDFLALIPGVEKAFPDCAVVVRPHPTESREIYNRLASQCLRVKVANEGNVIPWLLASQALIHNGCTTGVEAFALRVPSISYRNSVNDYYDKGFYGLSNSLSHQCFNFEELQETLKRILEGRLGAVDGDERRKILDHHLAAQEGPLACERIVDVLVDLADRMVKAKGPALRNRLKGWLQVTGRRITQRCRSYMPGALKSNAFNRHRYPEISRREVLERLQRFDTILGYEGRLHVDPIQGHLFRIGP